MQRTTIAIDEGLGRTLDEVTRARGYNSRSEAVRDLLREGLERWRAEAAESDHCVANLSYIVDRRIRTVLQRLTDMEHDNHDLVVSSMSVRLDHFHTLETSILKGTTAAVRAFAERIRSERGVRLGSMNMMEVLPGDDHSEQHGHIHHGHQHLSPASR